MKQKRKVKWDLLPAMLLFSIFPAMAKGSCVETGIGGYSWSPLGEQIYDFFMKFKSLCFLGMVIWMLVILTDRILLQQKLHLYGKIYFVMAAYALLTVLSACFSVDKKLSLSGMAEQYETVWTLLGYVVTCFYCAQVTENKEDIHILLKCLCVGAVLQGILGVLQAAGMDFWNTSLGKQILTFGMDGISGEDLVFQFADTKTNRVYMALYNPNYAGVYIVMLLPLMWIGVSNTSGRIWRIVAGLAGILLLICLAASGSKTGLIVLGILCVTGAWMVAEPSRKRWGYLATAAVLVLAVFFLYDLVGGHSFSKALKKSVCKKEYALTKMEPMQDGVEVCFKGETFLISSKQEEESSYRGLEFCTFTENGADYILIEWKGITWKFVKTENDDRYRYVNPYGKIDEIYEAETMLPGYEKAFSGRGYIWGRAAVFLKETIFLGKGPDTFTIIFPQQDYLMRANTSKKLFTQIRSKAHNMYLQTALQTGVISLVCVLVFCGNVLTNLYKKRKKDPILYTGMFLGMLAYLLMGFMNDSVVAVAPLFWGIMGMGMAMVCMEE